jgi:hypothetical protein
MNDPKFQMTNPKLQTNSKSQSTMTETILFGILFIGVYLGFGVWDFVLIQYCAALTNPIGPVIIVFPPGAA